MNAAPPERKAARGRDRRHLLPGRRRQVSVRYTDAEFAAVTEGARRAGLTPTGYVAQAALAAAGGGAPPRSEPWREALAEVMAARGQVRRLAINVNQAVRVLHATGQVPPLLGRAVQASDRAVRRLDVAAARLVRHL